MAADQQTDRQRAVTDLLILGLVAVLIIVWAGIVFFMIGDQPREWDYGVHRSVPGESYQSTRDVPDQAEPPPQVELPPPPKEPTP